MFFLCSESDFTYHLAQLLLIVFTLMSFFLFVEEKKTILKNFLIISFIFIHWVNHCCCTGRQLSMILIKIYILINFGINQVTPLSAQTNWLFFSPRLVSTPILKRALSRSCLITQTPSLVALLSNDGFLLQMFAMPDAALCMCGWRFCMAWA